MRRESLGVAFLPSRFSSVDAVETPDNPLEREARIRLYSRRAVRRLPLFEEPGFGGISARRVAHVESEESS